MKAGILLTNSNHVKIGLDLNFTSATLGALKIQWIRWQQWHFTDHSRRCNCPVKPSFSFKGIHMIKFVSSMTLDQMTNVIMGTLTDLRHHCQNCQNRKPIKFSSKWVEIIKLVLNIFWSVWHFPDHKTKATLLAWVISSAATYFAEVHKVNFSLCISVVATNFSEATPKIALLIPSMWSL